MSQLVPCPSCSRHVRLATARCPFCERSLDVDSLGDQYAPRRGGVQAGVKRAVLFAMGASMAAACGNEQPVYGAAVAPSGLPPVSSEPELTTTGPDEVPTFEAIYGAPVAPTSSTETTPVHPHSGTLSLADAGAPETDVTDAAARVEDAAADVAPADAATADLTSNVAAMDAAMDADGAAPDASLELPSQPTSVALYGAPPPN